EGGAERGGGRLARREVAGVAIAREPLVDREARGGDQRLRVGGRQLARCVGEASAGGGEGDARDAAAVLGALERPRGEQALEEERGGGARGGERHPGGGRSIRDNWRKHRCAVRLAS